MSHRRRKASMQCLNCGTSMLEGDRFCRHCGQENHDLRVPFRHFAYEFVESLTHFDTKLWNTLKQIFTRPGQLTRDFVEGKRARYVKPAQFYVFVSIIFFALVSWRIDRDVPKEDGRSVVKVNITGPEAELSEVLPDSVARLLVDDSLDLAELTMPIDAPDYERVAASLRGATDDRLDSLLLKARVEATPQRREHLRAALTTLPGTDHLEVPYTTTVNGYSMHFHDRQEEEHLRHRLPAFTDAQIDSLIEATGSGSNWLSRRTFRSMGRIDIDTEAGKKQLLQAMVRAISMVMFVLMPFTAVLLLWIFFRRRYYWEHLIFAIHIHTIYFLIFILFMLLQLAVPALPDWIGLLKFPLCILYLLLSLRRVYGRSWGATLARALMMAVPYSIALFVLMLAGVAWGFFSL